MVSRSERRLTPRYASFFSISKLVDKYVRVGHLENEIFE